MVLKDFALERKLPCRPDNLGTAVHTMAILGGYLNRRNDLAPGPTVIWRGYTQLATMAQTYERLLKLDPSSGLYQRLRPDKQCES